MFSFENRRPDWLHLEACLGVEEACVIVATTAVVVRTIGNQRGVFSTKRQEGIRKLSKIQATSALPVMFAEEKQYIILGEICKS